MFSTYAEPIGSDPVDSFARAQETRLAARRRLAFAFGVVEFLDAVVLFAETRHLALPRSLTAQTIALFDCAKPKLDAVIVDYRIITIGVPVPIRRCGIGGRRRLCCTLASTTASDRRCPCTMCR